MNSSRALGECAARGGWTLRANPRLVAVVVFETLLVGGLTVAGVLLPVLALLGGRSLSDLVALGEVRDAQTAADLWLALGSNFSADRLMQAGLLTLALWSLATLAWIYLQGVRWGALAAADGRGQHGCHVSFAVASWRALVRWGNRYFGRFFVFLNGYAVLVSLVFLAAVLCLAWAVRSGVAGKVLGAVGILLCGVLVLVLQLAFGLARALLARPGGTAANASRGAWTVLRRRPLAVAALAAAALLAALTVSALVSVAAEILRRFGADLGAVALLAQLLVQTIFGAVIAVWHGGALAALAALSAPLAPGVVAPASFQSEVAALGETS